MKCPLNEECLKLSAYVSCDIDSVKAVTEKFISVLLPFTCMERATNAHSVTYHILKMLDDKDVKRERKFKEEQMRQDLAAIHSLKNYLYEKLASSFRRCLTLPLSTREKVRRVVWG